MERSRILLKILCNHNIYNKAQSVGVQVVNVDKGSMLLSWHQYTIYNIYIKSKLIIYID